MISPTDLLAQADRLTRPHKLGRARQADLRRAVSATYYALFHRLLREGADQLVGRSPAKRELAAWTLVYRAFDHGEMARRCGQVSNPPSALPLVFSADVQSVAADFRVLQNERHAADYDPRVRLKAQTVRGRIEAVRGTIAVIDALPPEQSQLFVIFLLLGVQRQG